MPHHEWGDRWFENHQIALYKAMESIRAYVEKETGEYISMKEKYGTIRYEFIEGHSKETLVALHDAIGIAAEKFPEIKDEILEDSPFDDQSAPYWTSCHDCLE